MRYCVSACCVCLAVTLTACGRSDAPRDSSTTRGAFRIAVSNSYLEAAVGDLLNSREPLYRLAEPGSCPGHYDIRPSQVSDLRQCRVLLRFDFQKSLDAKLKNLTNGGLHICEIHIPGGLCVPSSYLAACRQIADMLVADQMAGRAELDDRLGEIERRVEAKSAWCLDQMARAGLTGRSVVCSGHQAAFCGWLGLKVAATFRGADTASVQEVEEAIREGESSGVVAVIANLPEGRRMADALGQRLNARVVVFGNFPMMQDEGPAFDALLTSNTAALLESKP